ncbi:MAG: YciI family protein, partial [bacterium]|nr:YciI family protein [bacterium]
MKRLITMALAAMCMMCMWSVAHAEDSYYIALGHLDHDAMSSPENLAKMGEHITYLGKLYADGKLVMAGPFGEGDQGLILLKAASMEEAQQLLHADPSIAAGLIEPVWIHSWQALFSRPDNRTLTSEQFAAMMESMPAGSNAAPSHQDAGGEGDMMEMTPGAVSFIQIPSTDAAASSKFYGDLFGWTSAPMDMGGMQMTFFTAPGG